MRHVDAFLDHAPRLLDQLGIDHGQERRVIADVVFHHQQHRHADGPRVVQDVAFILDVLDDRDQDAGIALPQKNAFDLGDWIPRHEILNLAIVISQHNDGNIQPGPLHLARQLRRVHVAHGEIGDDQIELPLRAGQLKRFRAAGDVRNPWDLPEVEFERFVDEQLVEPAIFAEDEGIVETGDEKNVLHLERHQVFEAFKALVGVQNRLGDAADAHGEMP